MKEFLIMNWGSILIAVILLVTLIFLYKYNRVQFYWLVDMLVADAEKKWGSKTGQIKYKEVYKNLPFLIKFLIPESTLNKMIEDSVARLREYLKSKKANLRGVDNE